MNDYYITINKILQILQDNVTLTTECVTIEQNVFNQIEKSFKSLIDLLKEADENELISNVFGNQQIATKFMTIFQTYIICCNNYQQQPIPPSSSSSSSSQNNGNGASSTTSAKDNNSKFKKSTLYLQIDSLAINSLRSLGYFLYSNNIVKCFSNEFSIREISTLLENTISVTKNKNICNYAIWCFSSQNFPNGPISSKLASTYCQLLSNTPFNSKTIENEILTSFNTLLQQNIQLYLNSIEIWLPLIFNKILRLDNLPNIIDNLKLILSTIINHYHIKNNVMSDKVSKVLLDQCDDYMNKLTLLYESKNELLSIQYWGYYVFFTGKLIFLNKMANKVLKLAENCFTHNNKFVKIESYNSWKLLIDSMDVEYINVDRRLELFIAPFKTGFTNENDSDVKKASFSTWMYFLKQFKTQLFDVFSKIFTPLYICILKNKKSNLTNGGESTVQGASTTTTTTTTQNLADLDLGESALHLLVSITASSQEVRKESKLKLQSLYGIVLDTLPITLNSQQITKCTTGDLEPFTLAISTNFISSSSSSSNQMMIEPFYNEKIEIWNGILKRMSNIDKKDQNYLAFLKNVLLFIQQLFAQLDTSILKSDDNELVFYRSIYLSTISNIPNSVLIGINGEYIIENINGGKNYVIIDFFILNLIEFGFKLNSAQIKEFLIPLFDTLCSNSFENNYIDLSSRLNFIIGVMNDNIDSDLDLIYLLNLWLSLTKTIHIFIKKSHQLLTLPLQSLIQSMESISNLLLWPIRAIATTPYYNDSSIKPSQMLDSNVKLWKKTFDSMVQLFSIKTSINPTIAFIIQSIDDSRLNCHFNYFDFILSILIPLLDTYDISNLISNPKSSTTTTTTNTNTTSKKLKSTNIFHPNYLIEIDPILPNILINLNNILINCHINKTMVQGGGIKFKVLSQLSPLFDSITSMVEKCKSVSFCLTLLKNMEGSLILYNTPNDANLISKLNNEERYQLTTLIRNSFFTLWQTTLDILIKKSVNGSESIYNNKLLEQMELLLVSAFTSSSIEIKDKVFYFWNEVWASNSSNSNSHDLIYPPILYKTFKKLENQIPIKLPNFNNQPQHQHQQQTVGNKRSNSHLDNPFMLSSKNSNNNNNNNGGGGGDNSFDDFNLPESEINKLNNNNTNLLNNNIQLLNNNNNNNGIKINNTNKNKKSKISIGGGIGGGNNDQYVLINKPMESDVGTQSLTEHQMEIYEKQKLKRNSSTSISSSSNINTTTTTTTTSTTLNNYNNNNNSNNTTPTLNGQQQLNGISNSQDKYLESEDILSAMKLINDRIFENQSTLNLLQIQNISLEISNKINSVLKNRLFK